jgi:YidC/Oxa1 family membrane protein insertase
MLKWLLPVILLMAVTPGVRAEITLDTDTLRLTFGPSGSLESAIGCFPSCNDENTRIQQFGSNNILVFEEFTAGSWNYSRTQSAAGLELKFTHSSGASTTWTVPSQGYLLRLKSDRPGAVAIRSGESFRPREAAGFGTWLEQSRYVIIDDGDVTQAGFDEEAEVTATDSGWLGYRNRYWTLLAAPPPISDARLETAGGQLDASLVVDAKPGEWSFYIGPIEPVILKQSAEGLDDILYAGLWFWLRWICLALFYLLSWIKMVVPSWGIAVMLLSLAVNILMTPLSRIADRLQQQVNETEARLAPELQRIKKNYKGEVQSAKILALYKTERVHPLYSLKSMMGVAVVIPVFIGAFDMLAENIHLLNTGFLWISDLSRPDSLFLMPFKLPFFGADLNLLPFLMTMLSFIASALHKPLALNAELRRKQVINMVLLAMVFFVLFYTFPAGMVLYWTTNNLISVTKSLWARR